MTAAILFNLFVFVFIIGMWVVFIVNIIRASKKKNDSRTSRGNQTGQTRSSRHQTRTAQPSRQRASNQNVGKSRGMQQFLRKNPVELYQILRDNLPDRYKKEVQDIFNAPNPGVELMKFLRRPDVWPLFQTILRDGSAPSPVRATPVKEKAKAFTFEDEIPAEADIIEEFDESSSYIFENWFTEDLEPWEDLVPARGNGQDGTEMERRKRNKKWLKDAVIASIILDRPES